MGILEKLQRLDERVIGPETTSRRTRVLGVFVGLLAVGVSTISLWPRDAGPEPLSIACVPPAQPVVEELVGLEVDVSTATSGDLERTAAWSSAGEEVVLVACRALALDDVLVERSRIADRGLDTHLVGTPDLLVIRGGDWPTRIDFVHQAALVTIRVAVEVTDQEARRLVDSWLEVEASLG